MLFGVSDGIRDITRRSGIVWRDKESPIPELGNDSGVFIGNVLEGSGRSGTPEGKGT